MPILPPQNKAPYDTAGYVLKMARAMGNDAIQSIAGQLLSKDQPYVFPFLNSAYRYMQRKLANAGVQTFKKTAILAAVPVIPSVDPGLTQAMGYSTFFDGANNQGAPLLPGDLLIPLRLRERRSGTVQMFQSMTVARDGLQSRPQSIWLRDWIWQGDQIIFNGATQVNDLEILYVAMLPDLADETSLVLILRAENALAAYTLAEFATARGSPLAETCRDMGDNFLKEILASDAMQKQRGNYRRQPYSRRAHGGWGWY